MKKIISKRLEKLRTKLEEMHLDAILITKRENYLYLSGFSGTSAFVIITRTQAILLTDFRYIEQATREASLYKIIQYKANAVEEIIKILNLNRVEKLGFEDNYFTYSKYCEYETKLSLKTLVPIGNMIELLRAKKDNFEMDMIKKAVEIADKTFEHIINYIKPGVREIEIAAELEYYMRRQGASGRSFETIVASGERSSMPHGVASTRKLKIGDVVTVDYGAVYKNYCSDITRTVFLGKPADEIKKIYNIVLEAQVKAIDAAVRGAICKDIDNVARDWISSHGYGKNFGHGLGHSLGLEVHEEPRFSISDEMKIENGTVMTVEPGIYIDGVWGVRIEDVILVDDEKPVVLTKATKEIVVL